MSPNVTSAVQLWRGEGFGPETRLSVDTTLDGQISAALPLRFCESSERVTVVVLISPFAHAAPSLAAGELPEKRGMTGAKAETPADGGERCG